MKEFVLVVIKPDGMQKPLTNEIMRRFSREGMELVAARTLRVSRELVESHYRHIQKQPFYKDVVDYLLGYFHGENKVMALIYYGDDGIKKCRKLAGATNPQEADPESIRGAFGQITDEGLYENVLHVSSDPADAEREIPLWFDQETLGVDLSLRSLRRRIRDSGKSISI